MDPGNLTSLRSCSVFTQDGGFKSFEFPKIKLYQLTKQNGLVGVPETTSLFCKC